MSIFTAIPALVWLILSGIVFAGGKYSSKEFALAPSAWWALSAILCYAGCALLWLPAIYQKNQLSITGALWTVIALLVTVGIGILVFGERPSLIGIAGIALGLVAVFLLSIA